MASGTGTIQTTAWAPLWVRDLANVLGQDESAMRNFLYKAGKLGYLTPIVKDRFSSQKRSTLIHV